MTNCLIRSPRRALHSFSGVCALLILLGTVTAQGATYYVATTGSDSNAGTSASPWRHPQRCTTSPVRAGDTCIVRSGTYTDTDGNGAVVWVYNRSSTPSGTSSQPITIKSERPLGAAIVAPSNRNGYGFIVQKPYYVIEGFDISGANNNSSTAAGVGISVGSTGVTVRSNSIHHIGRSSCTNSNSTFSGVTAQYVSGTVIERNRIYSIGRRLNGESGCVSNNEGHDHGIYIKGASNITVRRNVIYDSSRRGYPIHVYGGTTTNLNIYHNTFHGRGIDAPAHIILASTIRTANIKNNTSSDAKYAMIRLYGLTASGITVSHNLSSTSIRYGSASGVTFSNNIENINPAFIDKSRNDFRLTSSSPVINRGTTSGVPLVKDGRPDTSAYEYAEQNNIASPLTPTGVRTS